MKTFEFRTDQYLPIDIHIAWNFFSSPVNLQLITPPSLDFKIVRFDDREIHTGMMIQYTVRPLFGIQVKWKTLITDVKKPFSFTDKQLKGPYALWEHHHQFVPHNDGITVKDRVLYALPFGVLGSVMHTLVVKKKIEDIFDYRKNVLNDIFGTVTA